jgi:hypothetical protein
MSATGFDDGLVAGRSCGTCTVCCYALPIDTPEFQKLPGVVCANCSGKGCQIYDFRPTPCRGFYCGWWLLPQLDEEWRPDRCGILITPQSEDIPAEFELRDGIEFMILGGEDAVRRPGFVEVLCLFVSRRVATFISIPGPDGFFAAKARANEVLREAVAKNDRARVLSLLLLLVDKAKDHDFKPGVLKHAPAR